MSALVNRLQPIARMRVMLANMATDFGLADLSCNERNVLYAAADTMKQPDDIIHSGDMRENPLISDMSNPTFYRALGVLVQKGFLVHDSDCKRGEYRLNNPKA